VRVLGVNRMGRSCGLPALTPALSRKREREPFNSTPAFRLGIGREQFKVELELELELDLDLELELDLELDLDAWLNHFLTANAPLALTSFTRTSEAFFWSSA
jgi:hypothetical protein